MITVNTLRGMLRMLPLIHKLDLPARYTGKIDPFVLAELISEAQRKLADSIRDTINSRYLVPGDKVTCTYALEIEIRHASDVPD